MAWQTVTHAEVPPDAGPCYGADWGMVTFDDENVGKAEKLPPPPPDVVAEAAHKRALELAHERMHAEQQPA